MRKLEKAWQAKFWKFNRFIARVLVSTDNINIDFNCDYPPSLLCSRALYNMSCVSSINCNSVQSSLRLDIFNVLIFQTCKALVTFAMADTFYHYIVYISSRLTWNNNPTNIKTKNLKIELFVYPQNILVHDL